MSNEKEKFYKPIELICGICGQKDKDIYFWEGFDAAINLVLTTIDDSEMSTLPIVLREEILDEIELYKKGS